MKLNEIKSLNENSASSGVPQIIASALRAVVSDMKRHPLGRGADWRADPTEAYDGSFEVETRYWGKWEGDDGSGDYDWQTLSEASAKAVDTILRDVEKRHTGVKLTFNTGEKNWITIQAKAVVKEMRNEFSNERAKQRAMDREARNFKRDELRHELGHETGHRTINTTRHTVKSAGIKYPDSLPIAGFYPYRKGWENPGDTPEDWEYKSNSIEGRAFLRGQKDHADSLEEEVIDLKTMPQL